MENYEVYYNPISLIETKFIVLQLLKDGIDVLEDYKIGLSRILLEETDKNVKDYFDRMIYATAVALGLSLVTEDKELIKLANEYTLKPSNVLSWKSFWRNF